MKFTDKAGKKRNGICINCKFCNINFITRIDKPQIYCSTKCRDDARKTGVLVNCAFCYNTFTKRPSSLLNSKSGLYFCCRKCKDSAQKLGGIKEIMPPHYGTAIERAPYRRLFDGQDLICKRCGYNEFRSCIDIHHIDENKENNNPENLLELCKNCHFGFHHRQWTLSELENFEILT